MEAEAGVEVMPGIPLTKATPVATPESPQRPALSPQHDTISRGDQPASEGRWFSRQLPLRKGWGIVLA